jgi:hypothetical protein
MARQPLRTLRVDDETWSGYQAAAVAEGLSMSEWIRNACDGRVAAPTLEPVLEPLTQAVAGAAEAARAARKEICPHRRRPEEYCSRCD